ncbi:MAG TPA: hypothetical protein PK796_01690 [Bacteroidales bacterium]|jgi:hypothetical protein|nr:hypothetical protein [Bacteroidales bacterium]
MTTFIEQAGDLPYHLAKFQRLAAAMFITATYLPVLAVNASQVAFRKEYIAYAVNATDCRLFTFMNANRTYIESRIRPAPTQAIAITIGPAFARANAAIA